MKLEHARKAIQELAKKEGVSEETIRFEIERVISNAQLNADPQIQAFWEAVPHEGEKPSPEEVIAYIANHIGRG